MDKKGNATYLRLPLSLESMIENQARKEGRSKNEMIVHLIARGLYFEKMKNGFDVEDFTSNFFFCEGQNGDEK
jgi:hypothetical protein